MAIESGSELAKAVLLLGAGVVAVPLFKRLGLGAVLGYLVAGLALGPSGFGFFSDPATVLHVAELGVVMFLFIIGLETQPSRLWKLRRDIFGLGLAQVALCGVLLTLFGRYALGLAPAVAFIAAMGFVLTSTAIVMQVMAERGVTGTVAGQRIVSTLLMEDLSIVPLLALVAVLAPDNASGGDSRWVTIGIALVAVVGLVAVSRFLLNPLFRVLAAAQAREVMTGAALLVVLGAALAMQWGGLSMALGAFAAGVMLSESTFRHQLEADVEPFRGLLLGLFFMGVGMSLDLGLVRADGVWIVAGAVACMAIKGVGIFTVARLRGMATREAVWRAAAMGQGGEFAFVLFSAAAGAGVFDARLHALLTAAVIVSMALTPLVVMLVYRLMPDKPTNMDGVEDAAAMALPDSGVLVIGFGRFGQIACQALLARGIEVTTIDGNTDMIRAAASFGFKVYYGDGTRLDVLQASGAGRARAVLVCVNDKAAATRIVELMRNSFPLVPVLARAFDRQHAIELIKGGVDFQIRETFESALTFSGAALQQLGVTADEAQTLLDDIRQRDAERLQLQMAGGLQQGRDLLHGSRWTPTPLTKPQQSGQALNPEAAQELKRQAPSL